MKRPDYFVCLDSANKVKLTEAFDINKYIKIEDYWDLIIEKILISKWWNDQSIKISLELKTFNCRAAFLDSLYYKYFN